MNDAQTMVKEFHQTMHIPAPAEPDLPGSEESRTLRMILIDEEAAEFRLACGWDDVAGAFTKEPNPIEMIDALCDLVYVAYGAAVALGLDLEPFFEEVQKSNMAKAGAVMREDGKLLKPPGWKPPDIRGVYTSLYG